MHLQNETHNPEFCIIAPTQYLDFTLQSKSHLVLAHLVDTDPKYAEFYANLDDSHFIIMDNGAFELGKSYDPDQLIRLGTICNADVIVLPDYPNKPAQAGIDAANAVINDIIAAGFKTMFVPQSETGDLEDWIAAYNWAATNPNIDVIGMSILGIPNAIPHVHIGYARVVMTHILMERGFFNPEKHHHYLGLNSGPALEIPTLLNMGALDTCDSSGPVWSAILGHEYSANTDSYLSTSKPKMHVNFNQPRTSDQETLLRINYNIDATVGLFEFA
jgi:hypothetical protein